MKADVDCLPEPQLRFRTSHLTGHYGKRSGHVIRVPEDVGGVHNALQLVTGYGDTVLINKTYSEVTGPIRPPDSRTWTIDDSTPRMTPGPRSRAATATSARTAQSARVAQSARKCAGEPSYVLITTTGTLPEITTRVITLPTGEKVKILEETSKVNETHYAQMPTIQSSLGDRVINCGFGITYQKVPNRFAWHGIRFLGGTQSNGDQPAFFWLGGQDQGNPGGSTSVWHTGSGENLHPSNWTFNQCAFEADPLGLGTSVGTVADAVNVPWFAIVNCFGDKLWTLAGGDGKLFALTLGPAHIENNDVRGGCGAMWFAGGGGSSFVGDGPSNVVIRRNWYYAPLSWLPDAPHPTFTTMLGGGQGHLGPYGTITVNVDAAGNISQSPDTTYDGNGSVPGDDTFHVVGGAGPEYSVQRLHIAYSISTGVARQIVIGESANGAHRLRNAKLNEPWPGGAQSNMVVAFQRCGADFENTPTLYNSGMEATLADGSDAPQATTNTSNRHVALSAALPQYIADEVAAGRFPYFYHNFTFWQAWNGDPPPINVQTFPEYDPTHNAWGYQMPVTRAQALRKMIVAVDGDRMGFTFDSTQNLFATARTFPYSVVRSDGLRRHVFYHNKGSFENKTGTRWVIDGNVHDVGAYNNRIYALDQSSNGFVGAVTIVGNLATLHPGVSTPAGVTPSSWHPTVIAWAGRCGLGSPWYGVGLLNDLNPSEYVNTARWVDRILSPTTALLHPQDPRWPTAQMGDITAEPCFYIGTAFPWCEISHIIQRYNVWNGGSPPLIMAESQYESKVVPGGHVSIHDNLYLRIGDHASVGGAPAVFLTATIPTRPRPSGGGAVTYTPGGQAVYDEPPTTGAQGIWRYEHNMVARPTPFQRTLCSVFAGPYGSPVETKAKDIRLANNMYLGADGNFVPFVDNFLTTQEVSDPTTSWDMTSNVVAGNVVQGTGTLQEAWPRCTIMGPNSLVADIDAVGLPNYANTATDGYTLANYAMADIYTTGTVAIAADGVTVTHETGDFPTTVQALQFFKTSTNAALRRIIGVGAGLGGSWSTHGSLPKFIKRGGVAKPIGGGGTTPAFQTNTASLGTTQFVQATNVTGSLNFKLGIRCQAPPVMSGYFLNMGNEDGSGGTGPGHQYLNIAKFENGAVTEYFGAVGVLTFAPNDVWRLEFLSSLVLRVSKNGVALQDINVSSSGTVFTTGRAGIADLSNSPATTFSTFSCGDGGSPTTDSFTGGLDTFTLESAYPETSVTGKSFAVTFKGTATDGTDPGPDFATLALMVQGVRNPARAHF